MKPILHGLKELDIILIINKLKILFKLYYDSITKHVSAALDSTKMNKNY
jgi:hypothetical protein